MTRSKSVSAAFAAAVVLVGTGAAASSPYTLYDTLGGVENGGDPLAAVGPYLNDWILTGPTATLTSATFNLSLAGAPTGSFQAWVAKVDPMSMSGVTQYATLATIADTTLTGSFATYVVSPAFTYVLAANSFYVVGLYDSGASDAIWGNTVDPTVLARPSVIAGEFYYNSAGGVQANAGGPYELAVDVTNVPEPAAWAMMLAGFGAVGVALRAHRKTATAAA